MPVHECFPFPKTELIKKNQIPTLMFFPSLKPANKTKNRAQAPAGARARIGIPICSRIVVLYKVLLDFLCVVFYRFHEYSFPKLKA
jgi:hypothetical protein